jgi:hypothetical protein
MKLGKKPARKGAIKFKLKEYMPVLLIPPSEFGHEDLIPNWGILGNDKYGDCVIAGGLHETMLWNKEAGVVVNANEACAVYNYSAITGFDINNPDTDQGTDMQQAAEYRRTNGLVDADGGIHKVAAYLAVDHTRMTDIIAAAYYFQVIGIGIEFPSSAMDQFNAGQPWDVVDGADIEGGHYVSGVAMRGGNLVCVTWGKLQPVTLPFLRKYCDEAVVYLTEEDLVNGKTIDGFDYDALQADLNALKGNG